MKKLLSLFLFFAASLFIGCVTKEPVTLRFENADPTATFIEVSPKKTAYITFDDGPSRNNTIKNLNTLKKYGVKATFFILPKEHMEDIYIRILEEGHVIGNHSFEHDYEKLYSSLNYFKEDLLLAKGYMEDRFNYVTKVYRFPGGSKGRDPEIINERKRILEKYGYRYYDWDVTIADTDRGPRGKKVDALISNVLEGVKDRDRVIILMHDSEQMIYTAEALGDIIEGLKHRGYRFDVLTNLVE